MVIRCRHSPPSAKCRHCVFPCASQYTISFTATLLNLPFTLSRIYLFCSSLSFSKNLSSTPNSRSSVTGFMRYCAASTSKASSAYSLDVVRKNSLDRFPISRSFFAASIPRESDTPPGPGIKISIKIRSGA